MKSKTDGDKICKSSFSKSAIEQSDGFPIFHTLVLVLFYRLVPLILVEGYRNCTDTCQICDDNIVFNRSKASIKPQLGMMVPRKPYILHDNDFEGYGILVS